MRLSDSLLLDSYSALRVTGLAANGGSILEVTWTEKFVLNVCLA